jgi:hypothetical protein
MDTVNGQAHGMDSGDVRPSGAVVAAGSARVVPDGHRGAVTEPDALLVMIERAARDPAVDIDKMERLFQMQERRQAQIARMDYDAAFAAMQPELPEIDKRGKIIIREKGTEKVIQSTPYALWEDTNRLIKPILAKHGFGLSFRIGQTDARLTTTAVLSHSSGHREETSFAAPIDSTGSKNNVQGWGSSFSYGKRYTGTAILNITTKGEDDDGKAAGDKAPGVTTDDLRKLITETKSVEGWFLQNYSVETLDDLTAKQRTEAMAMLRNKAAKIGGRK